VTESRETPDASTLDYQHSRGPRDSAWSLVGFALSLVAAFLAALMWWGLWRSIGSGGRNVWYGVSPLYYVAVVVVAAVCVRGLWGGRKRFAVAGLILCAVSIASAAVLVRGSPW
jgi:hypothetical protein